jgi:hypothetical protein
MELTTCVMCLYVDIATRYCPLRLTELDSEFGLISESCHDAYAMQARGSASPSNVGIAHSRSIVAGWQSRCTKCCTVQGDGSRAGHLTGSEVTGDAEESLKCLECNIARKAAMIPMKSMTGVKRVMDGGS